MDKLKQIEKYKYGGILIALTSPLLIILIGRLLSDFVRAYFPLSLIILLVLLGGIISSVVLGIGMYVSNGIKYHKLKRELISEGKYIPAKNNFIRGIIFTTLVVGLGLFYRHLFL